MNAQELIGFAVEYADTFREWEVIPADEEIEIGELDLSWPYPTAWNDWTYRVADRNGHIRQKWVNEEHHWELIDGEHVVNIKNIWRNDLSIWKINSGDISIRYESRFRNIADEWQLEDDQIGNFYVYTQFEGDPRDWYIDDQLAANVPLAVKMAMIFITIRYSTPRR